MAELVRARLDGGVEKNVSDALAKKAGLTVLDESTRNADGTLRGDIRRAGRPRKQKTTVAQAAAEKADKKESDR